MNLLYSQTYRKKFVLNSLRDLLKNLQRLKNKNESLILKQIVMNAFAKGKRLQDYSQIENELRTTKSAVNMLREAALKEHPNQLAKVLRLAYNLSFYLKHNIQSPFRLVDASFHWCRRLEKNPQWKILLPEQKNFVEHILQKCIRSPLSSKNYNTLSEYFDDTNSEIHEIGIIECLDQTASDKLQNDLMNPYYNYYCKLFNFKQQTADIDNFVIDQLTQEKTSSNYSYLIGLELKIDINDKKTASLQSKLTK